MKLSELHKLVTYQYDPNHYEDPEVVIKIKLPYSTVGRQPTVPVKSMHMGFDWDNGKFIIYPEEELTPSDRDFAEKMQKMQDDLGWTMSENRGLKAEIKRLNKIIRELK